jgi:hypothetical protein
VSSLRSLKPIYACILKGYSVGLWRRRNIHIYVKHLTALDNADIDIEYLKFFENAKQYLPLEEDRLRELKDSGDWGKTEDLEIERLKSLIQNNVKSRGLVVLPSQLAIMDREIRKNRALLEKKEQKKVELVDVTAEIFAGKQLNEHYVSKCLYRSDDLQERLFSKEEWDGLRDEELSDLISVYNESMGALSKANLEEVAFSPFFLNAFFLCENLPLQFFGKSVCHLTCQQLDLFSLGIRFKNIFQDEENVPEEMTGAEVLNWAADKKSLEKNLDKSGIGDGDKNISVTGATKSDMEAMGLGHGPDTIDLAAEARKRGSNLSIQDIFELQHGKRPR